jgi:adenylate kinase family enzyme
MTVTATSFWHQAVLNAIGPLITAVFGLLLVGLAVNFITRAVQDRRTAIQIKYRLISEITVTASTLYHHTIQYYQSRDGAADSTRDKTAADDEYKKMREKLLDQYPTTRAQAEVLQARLTAYFEEPRVAVAWHAVRDCLTVRYYKEMGGDKSEHWKKIKDDNSKGKRNRFHTGLSPTDLNDRDTVNDAYKLHLKTTAQLIFVCPLRPRRNSRRAKRAIERVLVEVKDLYDYHEPAEPKRDPPPGVTKQAL